MRICQGATSLNALSPPIIMLFFFLKNCIQVYRYTIYFGWCNCEQRPTRTFGCAGGEAERLILPLTKRSFFTWENCIQVYRYTISHKWWVLCVSAEERLHWMPSPPPIIMFFLFSRKLYTSIQVYNFKKKKVFKEVIQKTISQKAKNWQWNIETNILRGIENISWTTKHWEQCFTLTTKHKKQIIYDKT